MKKVIQIKNLTYNYNNQVVFDDLNLEVERSTFLNIIGSNDTGKTTLSKIILGLIKVDSDIKIDGTILNDSSIKKIREQICYIPNNIQDSLIMDTVEEELYFNNDNKKEIERLIKEYNFESKLKEDPKTLSGGEQQIMYIISSLAKHPKIIICDEAFSMLDNLVKDKILKTLKKLSKEKQITIINFTNDSEDLMYGDEIAIIHNHKILIHDKKEIVLKNEEVFTKLNIKLPFMIELSNKLKLYNLLDNTVIDMDRMINKIWK